MYLGVDYYPEHWDKNMIDEDLENILELNCNVIRIGEFAWHMMESIEGNFDFSYFDRVIEKAKQKGLKVIFGTPTATMPAWLANKHPEVLSEDEFNNKRVFGGRRQYCFNSKTYYEYSERIIKKLANHYKDEKSIVAWQIDNEFGHEGSDLCYCECCKKEFNEYLKTAIERGEEFSTIIADADFFKRVNDTYGHLAGDYILRYIADTLTSNIRQDEKRPKDLIGRIGGEEFLVVLKNIPATVTLQRMNQIRESIANSNIVFEGQPINITCSFGVVHVPSKEIKLVPKNPEKIDMLRSQLQHTADLQLYKAKESSTCCL